MKTMIEKRLSNWMSVCMFVLLASVCLFSCDQKNANAEVSRSQADDYPLLESVEIPIDTVLFRYATYFRVQGDKVVIFDLHNTDYFCHTFTYPDFEYISSFAKRGEGPNEHLIADNVRWAGEEEMWVLDNNKNRMTRYSGIARGKKPKLEEHVKLEQALMRAYDFDMYNMKQVVIPDYSGEKRFSWVSIPSGKIHHKWMDIPMENKTIREKSPYAAAAGWRSFFSFTPDRKRLVTVNQFADRMDIYRLDNGMMKTFIGPENQEPRFDITSRGDAIPSGSICHYDVQVTDRYIYTIYDGRKFKDIMKEKGLYKQGGKLFRIYTHDGKLVKGYRLDRYIAGIYVDEATGMLYGLDVNADEQIVKFPQFRLP